MPTGRKPTPAGMIDTAKFKKSKDNIQQRQETEAELMSKSTLACPRMLSPDAQKEWRRVMKLYRSMKASILCDLDRQALIMYCEAVAIYNANQKKWAEAKVVAVQDADTQRILDKVFMNMERTAKIISSLSEQLCLTPVGRARMGMLAKKDEESDLDKFLNED